MRCDTDYFFDDRAFPSRLLTRLAFIYNAIRRARFAPGVRYSGTERNGRLIGSRQCHVSHATSFIIGVGRRNPVREEKYQRRCTPTDASCDFSASYRGRFASTGDAVSTSTTAIPRHSRFHGVRFPKVDTGRMREFITRMRALNCGKFSTDFTDDARQLPRAAGTTMRARKFDYGSLLFAPRVYAHARYVVCIRGM